MYIFFSAIFDLQYGIKKKKNHTSTKVSIFFFQTHPEIILIPPVGFFSSKTHGVDNP
jgi:hypothetical protein